MFVFIRLQSEPYTVPMCNGSHPKDTFLQGDYSSSAQFFVCVGVFGFLYCTATLILYMGYQSMYRQNTRGPIVVSRELYPGPKCVKEKQLKTKVLHSDCCHDNKRLKRL